MNELVTRTINMLSLCSGVGGIDLGLRRAGFRTVCYVEKNPYRVEVLKARIRDGSLDDAPIWDDITTFDGRPWCEFVHTIAAGFPCQPFSVAGNRQGIEDERYLWPGIYRVICDVRPEFVLLENVPGLLSMARGRIFGRILADLARLRYDAEWQSIPASAFGACHIRNRVFLLAYTCQEGRQRVLRRNLSYLTSSYSGWQSSTPLDDVWNRLTSLEESLGESSVLGIDDGTAYRVERLEAIGEAVVPAIAEHIGHCILDAVKEGAA